MRTHLPARGRLLLLLSLLFSLPSCTRSSETHRIPGASLPPEPLLVSAASSLTDAMNAIGTAFTKENPKTVVRFNFAASGALQQQIEQGAPVDVFTSASAKEIDALEKKSLLEPGTRANFAGNRLVLIVRPGSEVKRWDDLKAASVKKVALSDPDSVPSGRYAKETLIKRGLWASVAPKAVFGENVRQTLAYVAGGDVEAGIVFATDAAQDKGEVRVVAEATPGTDHTPIVYPAVVLANAPHKDAAKRFLAFLQTPTAQAILAQQGFTSGAAPK